MSINNIDFLWRNDKFEFELSSNTHLICSPGLINVLATYVDIRSNNMSLFMRKRNFCICENKDADQPRGNREADFST